MLCDLGVQDRQKQPPCERRTSAPTKPARPTKAGPPTLRDIRGEDLADDAALAELHRQAVAAQLWGGGEADRLDFFSLAERSRAHGRRPGALFAWLIKRHKTGFIALADEDRAAERLRTMRNGGRNRSRPEVQNPAPPCGPDRDAGLSEDARFAEAVIRVAKQSRMEPYRAARIKRPELTRDQWERIELEAVQARQRQWMPAGEAAGGLDPFEALKSLLGGAGIMGP